MTIKSPRFTPAMAVSILALVIALSSSATAALMITGAQVKNGSVTGKDIKDKSVTGKDIKKKTIDKKHIKKNAIKSKQVKDNSLTSADIRDKTITGTDVAFNTLTSDNLKDGTITTSDLSSTVLKQLGGAAGFEVMEFAAATSPTAATTVTGSCPAGKVAISANAFQTNPGVNSPQLQRVNASSFTARTPAVSLPNTTQLQVTCLTA